MLYINLEKAAYLKSVSLQKLFWLFLSLGHVYGILPFRSVYKNIFGLTEVISNSPEHDGMNYQGTPIEILAQAIIILLFRNPESENKTGNSSSHFEFRILCNDTCYTIMTCTSGLFFFYESSPSVGKSDEHLAPDRRVRVQGLPGETPPCTLMAPGACKIHRGSNALQVPIQIISLGQWRSVTDKLGYHTPTTFFLQMFMIVFYCRKLLFNR